MENFDYESLNPGIRETVRWFHLLGYTTTDSGDGLTRQFECDREDPYVVVKVDPKHLISMSDRIKLEMGSAAEHPNVLITGTYSPHDGYALIDISGIQDRIPLPDPSQFGKLVLPPRGIVHRVAMELSERLKSNPPEDR